MIISGAGISSTRFWIKRDFKTDTSLSLKWAQLANGAWVATDRTYVADVYRATVTVHAVEDTINSFMTTLYNNRVASGGNTLTMTDFASDEKIFGSDVDHTSVDVSVVDYENKTQKGLKSFSISVTLEANKPLTFTGTSGNVSFNHIDFGYTGDMEKTIKNIYSYSGTSYSADRRADSGVLDFTATMTIADAVNFRRTLAVQRGSAITTTIAKGINFPYGPNGSTTWPKNMKYLNVDDLGIMGQLYYRFRVKAVEDI
jgi:hypothetical protein